MVGMHCFRRELKFYLVMAQKSETPKDRLHDSDPSQAASPQRRQLLTVPDQWVRQRVQSMDAVTTFRQAEPPSRARVKSAPPVLFAAMKYGRQLRNITDEFDTLLNKGMIKMCSRAVSQKRRFPACLSFLWSRNESDAERRSH